jgi:hypothetical protein
MGPTFVGQQNAADLSEVQISTKLPARKLAHA